MTTHLPLMEHLSIRDVSDIRARCAAIVGARHVLSAPDDVAGHLVERRGLYEGRTLCVVRPGSTQEVADILAMANETGVPVVPQGGNTGLVGGQIPFEEGAEIVLSLSRLDTIRAVDPVGETLIVEAGVTLQNVQEAADAVDRLFPLSLASQGSCQIGGNLATNAGGMQVLAYGNARDLTLGLEVVLADGQIWDGLRTLRKDNTGYDLRHLFVGSEGTLGIITAAALKLAPKPAELSSGFIGVASLEDVAALYGIARGVAGSAITRFELLPRIGLDLVLKHAEGMRDPLDAPHLWYVLIEISGARADGAAEGQLLALLEDGATAGFVADAAVASSGAQADMFWTIRERISDVQGREGGSIKNDVAVPVADVPAFIAAADKAVEAVMPGARPVPFGHFGDGNIHYNILQPIGMEKTAFLAQWDFMCGVVNEVVLGFAGTISAEHGIGRMKQHLMAEIKSPVELALMRRIKTALDPNGILNPGKVL
ncbi:MAG: FAD-binding oxidoreductase [Pseudomonadota bacterium]